MKKNLLLAAVLCGLSMQSQNILWEKSYGGRQADYLAEALPTADYGFMLAGSSLSNLSGTKSKAGNGDLDYFLWKMDENGAEQWQKSYGGSATDILRSIRQTADGGMIIGGISDSPAGHDKTEKCRGGNDFWIIKLDPYGNALWQKTFGGNGQDDLLTACPTRDGGYIVGGSSDSGKSGDKTQGSRGNMDYWILKLDKDGSIEWQKTYGGQYADLLRALSPTLDGGYILGGYSNSPQSRDKADGNRGEGGDFWILKLDKKGDIEWQNTIGGEEDDQLYAIRQTYDKGYIVGGNSISGPTGNKSKTNKEGTDLWVVKLDGGGYIKWQETYSFGQNDVLTSIVENEDHSLLIGGYAKRTAKDKDDEYINDYIALKISENGDRIWDSTVGSDGEDILHSAIETRDGGYLLAGTSNPEQQDYTGSMGKEKSGSKSISIGNDGQLAGLGQVQDAIDDTVNGVADKVNDFVDDKVSGAANRINDKIGKAVGQKEDSKVKLGLNAPTGKLMNLTKPGGGGNLLDAAGDMLANKGPKPGLNASRDKKTNYGKNDFWVVKLGDKDRKAKVRENIEAMPNPVQEFTSITINFEYGKGTISVYDISGRPMQSLAITGERTTVLNMGSYPEGIYVVKVSTDKGESAMKIIKGIKK